MGEKAERLSMPLFVALAVLRHKYKGKIITTTGQEPEKVLALADIA